MSRKGGKNSNAGNGESSAKVRSGPKKELEIAIDILVELRDVRKKQIFLQMAEEIEDLKKKLSKALDLAEYHQKRAKDLTIENDWLHSLTCTPAVSPDKKITIHTPLNLDEISKKLKKINENSKKKPAESEPIEQSKEPRGRPRKIESNEQHQRSKLRSQCSQNRKLRPRNYSTMIVSEELCLRK